jgi:MFS family permease
LIPAFFLDGKTETPMTADQDETTEHTPLLASKDNASDYILPATTNRVYQYAPILRCFRNPSFSVAIILCAIYAAQLAAFDATVPIEARKLFSFGSLDAGLLFIPIACARLIAGPFGGWMVDKFNPRFVAVLGYCLLIPVYISFRFIESEPRQLEIGFYSLLLTLGGVCTALVATTSFVESSKLVDRYHSANPDLFGDRPPFGVLNGIYLAAFGMGSSVGPMIAGSLRNRWVAVSYGHELQELETDLFQYWIWKYERRDGWNCSFCGAYFLRLAREIFVGHQRVGRGGLDILPLSMTLTSSLRNCLKSNL